MMPTLPTLPATLPMRPEPATPSSSDATTASSTANPGSFARAMRDAEEPTKAADPAAEPATPHVARPVGRERSGPGRTRMGDTTAAADPSRASGSRMRAETADASKADAAHAAPRVGSDDTPASDEDIDAASSTETPVALVGASTPALPAWPPSLPPSRVALDRGLPHNGGEPAEAPAEAGRHALGSVGGHALPGRHPLAVVESRADAPAGMSRPTWPGEPRARTDDRVMDTLLAASAAASPSIKMATTEPVVAAALSTSTFELTSPMSPASAGAASQALDGLTGRSVAEPTRPTAEARLAAAPGSQAFTQALGEQVGLWVRDGVQEARLHLHPAELGPVQIQIALDGSSAQVDFHASHARTREAIEASLPALASALRESGFTLSGGGVFGQGAGDAPARTPPRAPRGGAGTASGNETVGAVNDDTLAATAARSRGWRRGLLDVFA